MCLAITQDDKYFIAGGQDKSIAIYNLENKSHYHTFTEAHEGTITSVNVSPCGNYFVSGSDDGSLGLFDVPNKQTINIVKNTHGARVEDAIFSPKREKNYFLF